MRPVQCIAAGLALCSSALAWGELGHRTVAYIAFNQLGDTVRQYLDNVLDLQPGQDISDVAIWADAVRRERKYSAPWHFIGREKQDDPPQNCSLVYPADCDKNSGCIVLALSNHTSIFVNSAPSLKVSRREALYFIIHFFGDIHQPLHTENLFRGGNDLPACFRGTCDHVNLHNVWDDYIPRAIAGVKVDPGTGEPPAGQEKTIAKRWAGDLLEHHNSSVPLLTACTNVKHTNDCATSIAKESNALVCSYAMAKGIDWLRGRDLGRDYVDGAVPIVELQILRAGIRLASWLDVIVKASEARAVSNARIGDLEL